MARSDELLEALAARGGVNPLQPTGFEIAGITTGPGGRTWDAIAAADCPDLPGEAVTLAVLEDRTIVVSEDVPDGALGPLLDALEETVVPPYRAAAARSEGTLWTGVAESFRAVTIPGVDGDTIELSVVGEERELTVDGEWATADVGPLEDLAAQHGDVAISAERVDGDLFAVDVFPL